jgi:tRNA nucleotidyltransferase (CCA-adding enzyme)
VVAEQQCFTLKDLDINGHDILDLGAEPGPQVGRVLNYLLDQVLDEEIENTYSVLREEALRFMKGD